MSGKKHVVEQLTLLSRDELLELSAMVMGEVLENRDFFLHKSVGHETLYHYTSGLVLDMIDYAAQHQLTADQMWGKIHEDVPGFSRNDHN